MILADGPKALDDFIDLYCIVVNHYQLYIKWP